MGWYRSESNSYYKKIAERIPDTTTLLISKHAKENDVYI